MTVLAGFLILIPVMTLGYKALVLFKISAEKDEALMLGGGLGFGLLAYGVLLLGLSHLLSPFNLWLLLILLTVLSLVWIREALSAAGEFLTSLFRSLNVLNVFLMLLFLIILAAGFLGSRAPELENDSLCYHLHIPKIYLSHGGVISLPYEVNAFFPMLFEMLFALGVGVAGVAVAKFANLAIVVLAALAIFTYVRHKTDATSGLFAVLLFLGAPVIANQLGTTYIDAGLAGLVAFMLISILRWQESQEMGWLALAGIFAGFALSTKYLALIPISAITLLIFWEGIRRKTPLGRTMSGFLVFSVLAFIFSACWYLRSYIELGNPVYPYFYSIFKSGDPAMTYDDIGVSKSLISFLMVPWTITMHPEKFEGFSVQIGVGFLAFLPLAFLQIKDSRSVRWLLFFSGFFLVCWFLLGQSLRFFAPAISALAILIGLALGGLQARFWAVQGMRWLLATILCFQAALAAYHYRAAYPAAIGLESGDQYLSRLERSFGAAQFVNQNLSQDAKILAADETHLFYFDRDIIRESIYDRKTRYGSRARSAAETLEVLKKDGFTHILKVESPQGALPMNKDPLTAPRILAERFDEIAGKVRPLYTGDFEENGKRFGYALYEILK